MGSSVKKRGEYPLCEKRNKEIRREFFDEIPDDTINSWIIRLMHRYSSLNFKQIQALGVHPGQLPILGVLRKKEGVSQREVAKLLHIKPPTVTVTLQRLEKSGFVYRQPDPEDQRISRIYLTEKGKNADKEIEGLIQDNEKILTRGFSEEEQEQLKRLFQRLVENLSEEADLW